jgi:hypothetical protein
VQAAEDVPVAEDDDEPAGRPDGHRYDAPETDEQRTSKGWDYLLLGVLVLVLLVLVATGVVPVFGS